MMILVINLAISFPNIVFTSHITANERFVFQKIVHMIKIVINPFVVLSILIMLVRSWCCLRATYRKITK